MCVLFKHPYGVFRGRSIDFDDVSNLCSLSIHSKDVVLCQFLLILVVPGHIFQVLIVCTVVPLSTGESFHDWIHRGLVILLTACPCAIVIGAPLATTCAIAAAATRGVLIKKPQTVELLQLV